VLEDTLGEFIILKHLEGYPSDADEATAAGWGGDRLGAWRNGSGEELVGWQLLWDSGPEAEELATAYRAVIANRFKGATAVDDVWWPAGGTSVALLQEGSLVWLVCMSDRQGGEALLANC